MSQDKDFEAIRQLKYRYGRCVDLRDYAALEEMLTADYVWEYSPHDDPGKLLVRTRQENFDFMKEKFVPELIAQHHMHHPELEITGDGMAEGTWYLEYFSCNVKTRQTARGTALYFDRYAKEGGVWKIARTRYRVIYRIEEPLADAARVTVHYHGWATAQKK